MASAEGEERLRDASNRFFGVGFYRDPDPRMAADALQHFLTGPHRDLEHVLFMFAQAARLFERVRFEFDCLSARDSSIADDVVKILRLSAEPGFPDFLAQPIVAPVVLDHLWGEFFLTGAEAPVQRIASALQWEDKVLRALTAWFGERTLLPWSHSAKAAKVSSLSRRGISFDTELPQLGNLFDLDLAVWKLMSAGFKVRAELPVAVPDSLIVHLSIKGAACWSLQSNALSHSIVRTIYEGVPNRARLPRFA